MMSPKVKPRGKNIVAPGTVMSACQDAGLNPEDED
jgi:hypothetical protein